MLGGICEYLKERSLDVKLYSGYIEVTKNKHSVQVNMDDGMIRCSVTLLDNGAMVNCRLFDIANPYSLQAIYEYVSSRKWK